MYSEKIVSSLTTTKNESYSCLHRQQSRRRAKVSKLYKFGFTSDRGRAEAESENPKGKKKADSKQNYEKNKRKRSFYTEWKDEFSWLDFDSEKNVMICVPCREYEKTGRFVEGTDNFRIDAIKSHNDSSSHEINMRNYQIKQQQSKSASTGAKSIFTTYTGEIDNRSQDTTTDLQQPGPSTSQVHALQPAVVGPMDIAVRRLNEDQIKQLTVCFNTAYFTAKEELPFTLYPKLLSLQPQNSAKRSKFIFYLV